MPIPSPHDLPPERLGSLLRSARRKAKLSRRRVARDAGLASSTLIALERGWERITPNVLDRLLAIYGTSVDALVPRREPVVVTASELSFGREIRVLAANARDEVLRDYLEALQRARGAGVTETAELRRTDLNALAVALDSDPELLAVRIARLVDCDIDEARGLADDLRRRIVTGLASATLGAAAITGVAAAPAASATTPPHRPAHHAAVTTHKAAKPKHAPTPAPDTGIFPGETPTQIFHG
jgi:transcriptional regulator with XRE-family HTH domain